MNPTSDDKNDIILDSAFHLFGSKGFYDTKMSEIAEAAGIAKGTIYLYFSSKEELFKAISKRDFEQFLTQLEDKFTTQNNSLEEILEEVARHHLTYFFERKEYRNLFFQAPNNDPDFWILLASYISRYIEIMEKVLQEKGLKEPFLQARGFLGILDAYKMDILFSTEFKEEDIQKRAAYAVKLFLKGCLPRE